MATFLAALLPAANVLAGAPSTLPSTVKAALTRGDAGVPKAADEAMARAALQQIRQLVPNLPRVGPLEHPKREWLPGAIRTAVGDLQFYQKLARTRLAPKAVQHTVHAVFERLIERGQVALGWTPWMRGHLAVLAFRNNVLTATMSHGAIHLSERELAGARVLAHVYRASPEPAQLLPAAVWAMRGVLVGKARIGACDKPQTPEDEPLAVALLAVTLGHELGHRLQGLAYSFPADGWPADENQTRELEADVAGFWLAACDGHPLHDLVVGHLMLGAMDAVARSQGVREQTYPPWEQRVRTAYHVVAAIAQAASDGRWPTACAPLQYEASRLPSEAATTAVLAELSAPAGLRRLLAPLQTEQRPVSR